MGVKIQCLTCEKIIESKYRHDWVPCDCPRDSDTFIYVDGGNDYCRMGAGASADWCVVDDPKELIEND